MAEELKRWDISQQEGVFTYKLGIYFYRGKIIKSAIRRGESNYAELSTIPLLRAYLIGSLSGRIRDLSYCLTLLLV